MLPQQGPDCGIAILAGVRWGYAGFCLSCLEGKGYGVATITGLDVSRQVRRQLGYRAIAALGILVLASCSSAPPPPTASDVLPSVEQEAPAGARAVSELPPARPQLVRRAAVRLRVASVAESQKEIGAIVLRQGGDILGSQSGQPEPGSRRSAALQLRVPQEQLDETLAALAALGTVLSRQVFAEDVTNQRVDLEARLRNLRRAEQTLLEIMERSGTVADVLEVARELTATREAIERIDTSLTNLKNQIAFSSIEISIVEARATTTPVARPLGEQLQAAWQQATRALGTLSSGLLRAIVWLLVFSPYWLSFGAIAIFIRRYRRASTGQERLPATATADSENEST